jgi:hypothetical protein
MRMPFSPFYCLWTDAQLEHSTSDGLHCSEPVLTAAVDTAPTLKCARICSFAPSFMGCPWEVHIRHLEVQIRAHSSVDGCNGHWLTLRLRVPAAAP